MTIQLMWRLCFRNACKSCCYLSLRCLYMTFCLACSLTVSSLFKDVKVSDRQAVIWCRITGGLDRYFGFKYKIVFSNLRLVLSHSSTGFCPLWHSNQKRCNFIHQFNSLLSDACNPHLNTEPLLFLCTENVRSVYLRRPPLEDAHMRYLDMYLRKCISLGQWQKFDLILVYRHILWFMCSCEMLLKGTVTLFLYLWGCSCLFSFLKVRPVGGPFIQPPNRGLRVKKFALVMISFWSVCPQRDTWWETIHITCVHYNLYRALLSVLLCTS